MFRPPYKSNGQLVNELEEMHHLSQEVESCEIQLQKAKEQYENLLGSAPDAMIFIDHFGRIVQANTQFERMFGFEKEEVIGRELDLLIPDRFRIKHRQDVERFLHSPGVHPIGSDYEIYALKKNGEEFPVDVILSPLQSDEGMLATAAIRDVTKRKQAEEEVKLNYFIQKVVNEMLQLSLEPYSLEEQCARILELLLSIPHFSHNARGAIYLVEDDPSLLIRKAQQGFPESEVLPCLRIPFGQCLCGQAAGDKGTVYTALDHYEGTRHCEGSFPHGHYCVPILLRGKTLGLINIYIREGHKRIGGEDAFLLAVAQTLAGIIDRYQAGQKLKSLEDQLHEAEKMAALWRLTENMAHEIRNPLMAIGGFTRRMEKQFPDGTKERKTIDLIVGEVKRIEKIMQEVESLSETGPLVLREGLLEAAAESVLRVRAKELTELGIRLQKNMPLCPRFFSIGKKLKRPLKI